MPHDSPLRAQIGVGRSSQRRDCGFLEFVVFVSRAKSCGSPPSPAKVANGASRKRETETLRLDRVEQGVSSHEPGGRRRPPALRSVFVLSHGLQCKDIIKRGSAVGFP